MIPLWVHHFDRRRVWSLLYFLIYAYLNISACRKFSLSLSTCIFLLSYYFWLHQEISTPHNKIRHKVEKRHFQLATNICLKRISPSWVNKSWSTRWNSTTHKYVASIAFCKKTRLLQLDDLVWFPNIFKSYLKTRGRID